MSGLLELLIELRVSSKIWRHNILLSNRRGGIMAGGGSTIARDVIPRTAALLPSLVEGLRVQGVIKPLQKAQRFLNTAGQKNSAAVTKIPHNYGI